MTNEERAERAQVALNAYCECDQDDDGSVLTDLLSDAMHLLGSEVVLNCVRVAKVHYQAELEGEE
jgi:hypothetical protein